jgi:hypothetical protein
VLIVLRRLAIPDRWIYLETTFRKTFQCLVNFYSHTLRLLEDSYKDVVTKLDVLRVLPQLSSFATAVAHSVGGEGEDDVVAFVDGKFGRACRPTNKDSLDYQQTVYNGHYRGHGLKIQSVMFADGIQVAFVESARLHDSNVLRTSGILQQMETLYIDGNEDRPAQLYGDPAYGNDLHLKRKEKGNGRTPEQKQKDGAMKPARESVEHGFCKVVALFPKLDYHKRSKLWWHISEREWIIAFFFTNLHTCFYGSQVNAFFEVHAPDIHEYIYNCHQGLLL